MMRIISTISLFSSLICLNVASDNSFLNIKILTNFTTDLLEIYENHQPQTMLVLQNMFAELNNYTNNLEHQGIHLRFKRESVSFSSCWKIPHEIDDDLQEILVGTANINEYFRSYYLDFLDDVYDAYLLRTFVARIFILYVDNLPSEIEKVYNSVHTKGVDGKENNLFDRLTEKLNKITVCGRSATKQQFLISLYSFIIQSELRAFLMMSTASKLEHLLSSRNITINVTNMQSLKENFLEKWGNYLKIMQKSLAATSTEFYDCSPSYESRLNDVYAINLSPTVINNEWNKLSKNYKYLYKLWSEEGIG